MDGVKDGVGITLLALVLLLVVWSLFSEDSIPPTKVERTEKIHGGELMPGWPKAEDAIHFPPLCADGEIMYYEGSNEFWVCATDMWKQVSD